MDERSVIDAVMERVLISVNECEGRGGDVKTEHMSTSAAGSRGSSNESSRTGDTVKDHADKDSGAAQKEKDRKNGKKRASSISRRSTSGSEFLEETLNCNDVTFARIPYVQNSQLVVVRMVMTERGYTTDARVVIGASSRVHDPADIVLVRHVHDRGIVADTNRVKVVVRGRMSAGNVHDHAIIIGVPDHVRVSWITVTIVDSLHRGRVAGFPRHLCDLVTVGRGFQDLKGGMCRYDIMFLRSMYRGHRNHLLSMPFTPRHSPPKDTNTDMTPEERDKRTVFIMQCAYGLFFTVARQTRPRDLEEFFSSVGHVRDVRIITDARTGRSKGICYVEFWEVESVPLALALNGEKLLGAPLVIQPTLAERNRVANNTVGSTIGFGPALFKGAVMLYVGQLHPSISEQMLRPIFEPFGRIDNMRLVTDSEGMSRGYAYVTYRYADDAKRAMEQLNGFELAGHVMNVGIVDEGKSALESAQRTLDTDDADRRGISLGMNGRLQLMAKLAEGTGLELPENAKKLLAKNQKQGDDSSNVSLPSFASECFVLSNMFTPDLEVGVQWANEIRDDVIEHCAPYGGKLP
ncbi:RNA-binding protein 39 [Toxocara canis]|uniref:RNA-binding protein 39 n=1 Tax=Toxocara canis TaxID=6265 RepID=A0A0B2V1H9_TOXCA|nr:RNA-binding protein 39 [Toxocara canis]